MRAVVTALVVLLAAGCGVPSTGVLSAGDPATGITTGLRVYFVAEGRLRGLPREDVKVDKVESAIKLLLAGPNETRMKTSKAVPAGVLTTRLAVIGGFRASAGRGKVTLTLPDTPLDGLSGLAMGQLVCTVASANAMLHDGSPADVDVTVMAAGKRGGPYRCSQFRTD